MIFYEVNYALLPFFNTEYTLLFLYKIFCDCFDFMCITCFQILFTTIKNVIVLTVLCFFLFCKPVIVNKTQHKTLL